MSIQGLTFKDKDGNVITGGGATSKMDLYVSANQNTGTKLRTPTTKTFTATGGNSVTLTVEQNGDLMNLNTTETKLDWGVVGYQLTITKTLHGTSNAEQLEFSSINTDFWKPKNATPQGIPQFTVTPSGGTAITCTSGLPISGDPGGDAVYEWSIDLVNVTYSADLSDDAHGRITVIAKLPSSSSVSPITKECELAQTKTPWVKINYDTEPVTITLDASGTLIDDKPFVSSNTLWTIS